MTEWALFTESSANVGGQELQCMQQMAAFEAAGFQAMLACRPGSRVEQVALARGLRCLPVAFRNSLHPPSVLSLRRWIRAHRPRLAICHSGHDSNVLAIAARLAGGARPFILRSRTYQPGKPAAWSYNHLADATMVPSRYLRDCLLANPAIRQERVRVVYPGIDFAGIDAAAGQPLPAGVEAWLAAGEGPVLVHAAMLRGEKGHPTLLQALHLLRERGVAARYLIAGEGPEEATIRARIVELGLQDRVWLAGVVSPVAPLLARADLVVMPSGYEPLGMSQLEALGLGVPVIASDTGGIPETISHGQTGLLVPPGDAAAWAEAIASALDDYPAMRRMAEQGRREVRARFSPARNLSQVLQLAGLVPAGKDDGYA